MGKNGLENNEGKFLILDGHSLAYRAFYALPLELKTKTGLYTGAVLGFTNMLIKLIKEQRPAYIAVCLDYPAPTFRHEKYEEYKATREKTPLEMTEQLPLIKEMLSSFNIPVFELEGYEADDIIGFFSRQIEERDLEAVIVTADSDFYQLLSPKVNILITKKGITELELFTVEKFKEKYSLTPEQWIDFKALKGDTSDNVPGVPSVGEKRALKLLQDFGSLEKILQYKDNIGGKLKEAISQYSSDALLSKELVTIRRDLPLNLSLEECRFTGPDWYSLYSLCQRLEFKSIISKLKEIPEFKGATRGAEEESGGAKDLKGENGSGQLTLEREEMPAKKDKQGKHGGEGDVSSNTSGLPGVIYFYSENVVNDFLIEARKGGEFSFLLHCSYDKEGRNPLNLFFALSDEEKYCFPLNSGLDEVFNKLWREVLLDPDLTLITHDVKNVLKFIIRKANINFEDIKCNLWDTMLASYLINPDEENQLFTLLERYLDVQFEELKQQFNEDFSLLINSVPRLFELKDVLADLLEGRELKKLYYDIELPLVEVLLKMELRGIKISTEVLDKLEREMNETMASLQDEIFQMAGFEFNLNSPKQLSHVLFEKLNLPVIRKIKTGYSTDAKVLQELSAYHPIAAKIVQYRTVAKLKNTYIEGLRPLIDPETGKIHTTFNQAVTSTGRLSSSQPNLQNIPIRLEEGRRLREAFGPSCEDKILLAADYSQIELRILAHLSQDQNLLDAFRKEQDIHTRTAAEVFEVPLTEVTTEMRSRAKAVNFGIIYGMSDYGLSQDLGITRAEAREYINSYFERYTGVKEYVDHCIAEAREKGYVTTVFNRRRYLPDINHRNFTRRSFAERMARNTPIQGSAADIIKAAMVAIEKRFEKENFQAEMLLQVHDELIFQLPQDELNETADRVKEIMERVFSLSVPLIVELKKGKNWYHMSSL